MARGKEETLDEDERLRLRPRPHLWAKLGPRAKELRRSSTSAEDSLWQALRYLRLAGSKFRRQHAIGRFIVDFYCPAAHLVVEVDGLIHERQVEEDAMRTAFLEEHGLRVMRFRNEEVMTDLESVLASIRAAL
jgi:very-short-patch-repair endonuclease